MANETDLKCPHCLKLLRVKKSPESLAGKKIKCPACSEAFACSEAMQEAASAPLQSAPAPAPLQSAPAPKKRRPPIPSAEAEAGSVGERPKRPRRKKAAASASSSPERKRPPKKKARKKKRRPVEDPYAFDDLNSFDAGGDGDWLGDGDQSFDDPYAAPQMAKKKKKSGGKKSKSKSRSSGGRGFFAWFGFGAVAGLLCMVPHALLGFTGLGILHRILTIVTGSVVGGAVRAAAGDRDGTGPGVMAVVLTFFSIWAGNAAWLSTEPELTAFFDHEMGDVGPQTRQEAEQYAIADVADEVETDTAWLQQNGITREQIEAHSEEATGDVLSEYYLPAVWQEAERRWQEIPEADREAEINGWMPGEDAEALAEAGDAVVGTFKWIAIIGGGFAQIFWLFGPLICSVSAMITAYKLGAGMATD